ncbi:MAG: hypothetical protein H7A23_18545 [Leptospiraceae bacterium]|nr:hypothetical protein [Leptospiraceae bacterium]MCP5496551.1 hypothetical protein [Leptospiraceae bacterium]
MDKQKDIFSNLSITVDLGKTVKKQKRKNLSDVYYDFYFPGCKVDFVGEKQNLEDKEDNNQNEQNQ